MADANRPRDTPISNIRRIPAPRANAFQSASRFVASAASARIARSSRLMFAFHVIDEFHGVHVHVQRLLTEGVRLQFGAKIVFRDTLKRMNLELVLYADFG